MDNLLNFPTQTFVGRPVPKNAFYQNLEVNAGMKQRFVEDVAAITWLYKLSPTVVNLTAGKEVEEIVVFLVQLKEKACPSDVFLFIDKNMPRHVVFLLEQQGLYRLLLNYKEWTNKAEGKFAIVRTLCSHWLPLADIVLPLEGNDLDQVYTAMCAAISGLTATAPQQTKQLLEITEALAKKEKQTEALRKKIRAEKQLHRQMELNAQLRALKAEVEEIRQKLQDLQ